MHGDQEWLKKKKHHSFVPFSEGGKLGVFRVNGLTFGHLNWAPQPVLSWPWAGSLEPYSFFGCFQSFGLAKTCSLLLRSSCSTTVFSPSCPQARLWISLQQKHLRRSCVCHDDFVWFCGVLTRDSTSIILMLDRVDSESSKQLTLPETNSSHLKKWMVGRTNFLLGWPVFRGRLLLVSGRVILFLESNGSFPLK